MTTCRRLQAVHTASSFARRRTPDCINNSGQGQGDNLLAHGLIPGFFNHDPSGFQVVKQAGASDKNWWRHGFRSVKLVEIPTPADQYAFAQPRIPIDMMVHGRPAALVHASEQWSTMSS